MPDPRATVTQVGIRNERTTYTIDNSTITFDATKTGGAAGVSLAVTLSSNGIVALAADGDAILGKLELVEFDGSCSVTDTGFVELPGGTSATLTPGTKIVGALGPSSAKGYIRSAASATAAELLKGRGLIINAATAAKTVVKL